MATSLRKTDPFESILIQMVEMHRTKQADYEKDPGAAYGTNFDEVAREIPLPFVPLGCSCE